MGVRGGGGAGAKLELAVGGVAGEAIEVDQVVVDLEEGK